MADKTGTYSLLEISKLFDIDRATVTKYLQKYEHDHGKGNRKRYTMKKACIALSPYFIKYSKERESSRDVDDLSPVEKKHHFEALLKKRQLEEEEGLLTRTSEVRDDFATALKSLSLGIEIIPDRIELAVGLAPDQIRQCQIVCREILDNLYRDLGKELNG